MILFENRGGRVGFVVHQDLAKEVFLERPALGGSVGELHEELVRTLVAEGLFEKEARAMVKTWKDQWFEEGLRVFTIVPRRFTDRVLPLALDPRPADLVRVLVGRAELITPEMEREALAVAVSYSGGRVVRDEAATKIRKFGRFAESVLRKALASVQEEDVKKRSLEILTGAR